MPIIPRYMIQFNSSQSYFMDMQIQSEVYYIQMKSRHSIEIKALIEQNKITKSRYNPESSINITTCSTINTKTLKRLESSSTLRRVDSQIFIIEDRYRLLQQNYRALLDETRIKGEVFRRQKEELEKYKYLHEKDQKEITQLRTLLGIVRKNQSGFNLTQPSMSENVLARTEKNYNSVPKERRSPLGNKASQLNRESLTSKQATPLKKMNSRVRCDAQGRIQFSKYKFVPSLPLQ